MLNLQLPNWVAPLFSHRLKVPEADWGATCAAVSEIAEVAARTEELLASGGSAMRAADDWFTPAEVDQLSRTLARGRGSGVFLHPGWETQLELLSVGVWSTSSHLAYVAWLAAPPEDRYSRAQRAQTWLRASEADVGPRNARKALQERLKALESTDHLLATRMSQPEIEEQQRALPALDPELLHQLRISVRKDLAMLMATSARIDKALSRVPRWRAPRGT